MSEDGGLLDEVAGDLLVLPPSRFTAARNARAAEVGGSTGRRIAKLRKPTVAAWAVNLLVRDGQLAEAVDLSRALHEAQDDLDAAELARLGTQRRQLVAALARRARELADEAGTPLSPAMSDAVEKTINAAVVDDSVAAAVLTGRLVSPVDLADLDRDQLGEAVAGTLPTAVPSAEPRDDLAERRRRRATERAVRDAERARSEAERDRSSAEKALAAARERADRSHERLDTVRVELARAEADAAEADAVVRAREDARAEAAAAVTDAERALTTARAAHEDGGAE